MANNLPGLISFWIQDIKKVEVAVEILAKLITNLQCNEVIKKSLLCDIEKTMALLRKGKVNGRKDNQDYSSRNQVLSGRPETNICVTKK